MTKEYPTPIVAVYAQHLDRNSLLGYAMGNRDDIAAYFDDRKDYGLEMEEVTPILIPSGYAGTKKSLMKRKEALEAEMSRIQAQIEFPE